MPDHHAHAADLNLLKQLLQQGRTAEAQALAAKAAPQDADIHHALGNAWSAQDRFAEAETCFRRVVQLLPGAAVAHYSLGTTLRKAGNIGEAKASLREALRLAPNLAEAQCELALCLVSEGDNAEAERLFKQAIAAKPALTPAHYNLGNLYRASGRLDDAAAAYRGAVQQAPGFIAARQNLGNTLTDLGRLDEAETCLREALALAPQSAELHYNLAVNLRNQGRAGEAETAYRATLALQPGKVLALAALADLYSARGDFAEAGRYIELALQQAPDLPEAWAAIPRLRQMKAEDGAWLAQVTRITQQTLSPQHGAMLHAAIGKYHDDLKQYDQAFSHHARAKEYLRRIDAPYDRSGHKHAVDLHMRHFTRGHFAVSRAYGNTSRKPVLIVGMPRSGTTLAEQILSAHPQAGTIGESLYWNNIAARITQTPQTGAAYRAAMSAAAQGYLDHLARLAGNAARVIDKMPTNFLHLGMVCDALPDVRIIHMQRDALDTCVSIYSQHFQGSHPYANDLADLAHYYRQYERLMRHWEDNLPPGTLLTVPYEALVDDQESWSRRMIEFIGLPWDADCLDFQANGNGAMTVSSWQVRQGLYRSSVKRHSHYDKHLDTLRAGLAASD